MALRSPLLPLAACALAAAVPWAGSKVLTLLFALCTVSAAWRWWIGLAISVDGVCYKEPFGGGEVSHSAPRRAAGSEPSQAGRSRKRNSPRSPQDGFVTPREGDATEEPTNFGGLAARGVTEWAPWAPSLPYGEPPGVAPGALPSSHWLDCDAAVFDVRNIRYKQTREKVSSDFALYECVGMDMIRDKRRIDAVLDHLPQLTPLSEGGTASPEAQQALPASPVGTPDWSASWGAPRVLLVNCQLPYRAGRLLGAHPEDDGGLSILNYFVLSRPSSELLARGTPTPALRLWRRFVEEGASTKDGISFKAVGRVEDMEKYEVPESFYRFNNKPVLITKTATVLTHRLPEVLEIDFDVRNWGFPARSALANYHHRAKEAELEVGYLIEGKADDELPEQILGCVKVGNVDITAARWVSLM